MCDATCSTLAVSTRVLELLKPAQLEVAVEAIRQLETNADAMSRQWQMQIERATYHAQLAERRYEEVDPSHRLVASTLEERWNDALVELEQLKTQHAALRQQHARPISAEQRAQVLALAQDFPRLWNAPTTQAKDKKRMLRLLVKDITVERCAERKRLVLHVRWEGGACEGIHIQLPPSAADQVRYPEAIIARVRELAGELVDDQIADTLNRERWQPTKGEAFNASIVKWIRYKHQIRPPVLKRPEELSVQEVAQRFGVSSHVVYYWIEHDVIQARRLNKGSPYWITLTSNKTQELRTWVRSSRKISKRRGEH
ncbi:MAG: hypothetical protein ACRD2X_22570 [Vicinamibacteraceae bacterium]